MMSGKPFDTPFEWVGGEDKVRALSDRFYDLMDLEPAYAEVAGHAPHHARDHPRSSSSSCAGGSAGRSTTWSGSAILACGCGTCRSPSGLKERDQWLACMHQAMVELELDPELIERLDKSFFQTADFMRSKGG